MKLASLRIQASTLLLPATLVLSSCSSTPKLEPNTTTVYKPGVPGGIIVETYQDTAKVTAIDPATRKITLVTPDGRKETFKAGPEVINFDQIHVGDQVKAMLTERLAVYMAKDNPSASEAAATVVSLAPKGAKPGGLVANTVQVIAKVTAIDLKNHKATLELPDGSTKTVAVRPDVDLTKRQVGEEVVIRMTEAIAISVEKP